MKKLLTGMCFLATLAAFAPLAHADGDHVMSEAEIRNAVMQNVLAQQQQALAAGGQDSLVLAPNGQVISLPGVLPEEEEEESNVTFRYEGANKGFNKIEPPLRTFNNIDYPY